MNFEKLDYDGYLFWNGNRVKKLPIAKKIKDGSCDYYILEKEDIFIELYVFKEENNLVNCNICNAINFEYDLTMDLLKNTYGKVTFKQDNNIYGEELFNKIKNTYKVISEKEEFINKRFKLNVLYVDLNKTKDDK